MKFLTLEAGQLGALIDDTVVDIAEAERTLPSAVDIAHVQALVAAGDAVAAEVWALAQQARAESVACRPFAEVRPQAPIPEPLRNILCLGKNYLEHAQEVGCLLYTSDAADEVVPV